jgi:hypothetical protein
MCTTRNADSHCCFTGQPAASSRSLAGYWLVGGMLNAKEVFLYLPGRYHTVQVVICVQVDQPLHLLKIHIVAGLNLAVFFGLGI